MYRRQLSPNSKTLLIFQAIKEDVEAPLAVFDKRAATYIKLGKLDLAVSDAASIIRRETKIATVRYPLTLTTTVN